MSQENQKLCMWDLVTPADILQELEGYWTQGFDKQDEETIIAILTPLLKKQFECGLQRAANVADEYGKDQAQQSQDTNDNKIQLEHMANSKTAFAIETKILSLIGESE